MAHYLRTILNALVVVALATAGIVRGEVLCIGRGGHVAVEALGECEASGHAARDGGSVANPSCVDIPLAGLSAGWIESSSPKVLPPQVLLDVAALVTPVVPLRVHSTAIHLVPPALSAPPTRSVALLI